MRRYFTTFIALAALLLTFHSNAQDKKLTLQDCVWMNPELYPQRIANPAWIPGEDTYTYVEGTDIIKVQAKNGVEETIFSLDKLNALMSESGNDSLRRIPSVKWIDSDNFFFLSQSKAFVCNLSSETIHKKNSWPEDAENLDLNKKTFVAAYTKGKNIFISKNGVETQITNDTEEGVLNGSSRVARSEFGIGKGTFWSENGKYLAFYKMDESMVTSYPLVNISSRIAELEKTRYPMAGMKSHQVMLAIYDVEKGKMVLAETEKNSEQYLTMITWDPSEEYFYIGVLNREQDHLKINKYDAATGAFLKTLYEETDEQYVEPEMPLYFHDAIPGKFILKSYRDGYDHFYLFDTNGKMLSQLTKGHWDDNDILGFDKKGKTMFFTSRAKSPVECHVYSLNMKTLETERLTPQHGNHKPIFSTTGKYFIDVFTSTDVCREYQLIDNKGTIIRTILENKNPLDNYNTGDYELMTLKAKDGSDLWCRMIKPPDFDPSKKYPVFLYVYGGPHSQLVSDSWNAGAGLFDMYMAQNGYVVFTMDNHGTNHRGADFEQVIHRNLGVLEVEDQMIGVDYLKSLPYVDGERMGVDGWSYGGFMTLSMMLKNPGIFKVACAGGPVVDWKWYEIMYGERYMDTPEENPDGYDNASLLNYVKNLEGNVLVIHGTMDPVVVWQHSLSLIQQSVEDGVHIDYFVYPGHEHNVGGADRMHLYEKIANYFDLHLK